MKLYLVRHGEAVSEDISAKGGSLPRRQADASGGNPERPLTEKGRLDVEKVALFLKKAGVEVALIWHSTKKRAHQTAQIMEKVLGAKKGISQKDNLKPNDSPEEIIKEIKGLSNSLMVVGHLPFLAKLASKLLSNDESPTIVRFHQGGCVFLEQKNGNSWELVWAIAPNLINGGRI